MADIPVAFVFAGNLPRSVAARMIDSVREAMPQSPIIHQTDLDTEAFPDCEVVRLAWENRQDVAEFFWRHLVELGDTGQDFIKLDYDCVMQQSVRGVFNRDFQAGLTVRDERDVSLANAFRLRHPHNAGVMFSKGKHTFWQEVYDIYCGIANRDGWMDACDALEMAVERTKVKIEDFPAFEYNFTPISPYERLENKFVVHYKGNRKHWTGCTEAMDAGSDVARRVNEWKRKVCGEQGIVPHTLDV